MNKKKSNFDRIMDGLNEAQRLLTKLERAARERDALEMALRAAWAASESEWQINRLLEITENEISDNKNTASKSVRELIEQCKSQFDFYAKSHRAKGTPDGEKKAAVNQEFADRCNAFLVYGDSGDENVKITALTEEIDELRTALRLCLNALMQHEQWEADLILSSEETTSGIPAPSEVMWDSLTDKLQPTRNLAISAARISLGKE